LDSQGGAGVEESSLLHEAVGMAQSVEGVPHTAPGLLVEMDIHVTTAAVKTSSFPGADVVPLVGVSLVGASPHPLLRDCSSVEENRANEGKGVAVAEQTSRPEILGQSMSFGLFFCSRNRLLLLKDPLPPPTLGEG